MPETMPCVALIGAPALGLPALDEKNARHLAATTEPERDDKPLAHPARQHY